MSDDVPSKPAVDLAKGRSVGPPMHVDRVSINPLVAGLDQRLRARFRSIDDPRIGAQEREGRATYVYISEPHADDECPFGPGEVLEAEDA